MGSVVNAREQAREAAQAAAHNDDIDAMYGAEAASDVWEPLMRKVLDTWDEVQHWNSLDAYVIMLAVINEVRADAFDEDPKLLGEL